MKFGGGGVGGGWGACVRVRYDDWGQRHDCVPVVAGRDLKEREHGMQRRVEIFRVVFAACHALVTSIISN